MGEMLFLSFPALLLIIAAVNDIRYHRIPAQLTVFGTAVSAAAPAFGVSLWHVMTRLAAAFVTLLALTLITLVCERILKKKLLGGGDILLIFMSCLYLDWTENMYALLSACIVAIAVYLVRFRQRRDTAFPLAPFLAFGWLAAILGRVTVTLH